MAEIPRETVDVVRQERRGWRAGFSGRPENPPVEPPDLTPDASTIFVEGRANMPFWTPAMRTKFNAATRLLADLGLVMQEVAFESVRGRRSWTSERVPLDSALSAIKAAPGITFDGWLTAVYPPTVAGNAKAAKAARSKAAVALSKLVADGRVVKRYGLSGVMLLYAAGAAPKDSSVLEKRLPIAARKPEVIAAITAATKAER